MKKILLIAIMVLSNIFIVNAEKLPTIEVGSYAANINEEITIPVSIKNNIGFTYIGFKINYDIESLEYVDSKLIGLENFYLKEITNNKNNRIVMYAISLNDKDIIKKDTKLAEITFKVKKNAKTSDLKIEVTDLGTNENKNMKFQGISGKVTIAKEVKVNDSVDAKDFEVENPKDYNWESSDPKIANVDENGEVTFKDNGEVTITQKDKDDNVINTKTYTVGKIANNKTSSTSINNYLIIIIVIVALLIIGIITYILIKHRHNNEH